MLHDSRSDVLVAGAGPAGCAVAVGLARLGFTVSVLSMPRPFAAIEGVSARVREGLRYANLPRAADAIPPATPRAARWGGERREANTESLVERAVLDAALRADLDDAGIRVLPLRLRRVRCTAQGGVEVDVGDGRLMSAALLVDARGRSAFARRACAMRGPDSLALVQRWRGPPSAPASQVMSVTAGWLWLARLADGTRYTQISTSADAPGLPARAGLSAWLQETIAAEPEAQSWVEGCVARGRPVARASTAWLHAAPCADGVLRVGDAAMAVDPLSGNGIFQALSSASVAPAVVNTLLRDPVNAALAADFYRERLREIFFRFARIGRDFHASETRSAQEAFWLPRAAWPDAIPAHAKERRVSAIARRAVVEEGWIRERELAITPEQPLGVWRVAGVEIVPWLRMPLPERRIRLDALDDAFTRAALGAWLRAHGELPD